MSRIASIVGSAIFFTIAPGTIAGVVPYWLTGWRVQPPFLGVIAFRAVGAILAAAGLALLVNCFVRFALEGHGTPAPIAPTETLVVSGPYRHVRNPMYVAVVSIVAGQALILGSGGLAVYAGATWLVFHLFVLAYEEPALRRRYGASYDAYRVHVRRWWPRIRPWLGSAHE